VKELFFHTLLYQLSLRENHSLPIIIIPQQNEKVNSFTEIFCQLSLIFPTLLFYDKKMPQVGKSLRRILAYS
jgi:hypothetical protein